MPNSLRPLSNQQISPVITFFILLHSLDKSCVLIAMVGMQIAILGHFLEVKPSTGEFNEENFKLK